MARRSKRRTSDKGKQVLGLLALVLALLLLVSLVTHSRLDDSRITGSVDTNLNPFEMQYRNQAGMMGAYLSFVATFLIGWLAYFVPLGLILLATRWLFQKLNERLQLHSILLFVISLAGTMLYNIHLVAHRGVGFETGAIGGYVSENLTALSIQLVGDVGSYIVLSGLVLILLVTYTSINPLLALRIRIPGGQTLKTAYHKIADTATNLLTFGWLLWIVRRSRDEGEDLEEDDESDHYVLPRPELDRKAAPSSDEQETTSESEKPAEGSTRRRATIARKAAEPVKVKSVDYAYPQLDLLHENPVSGASVSADELSFTARLLRETLETFGVSIDGNIEKFPGPIITRYEFKPGTGVKVNQIINLSDDLALALKAKRIRIVAPIPGKAAVGVEIPNRQPQGVFLKEILSSEAYTRTDFTLPLALGKTISGRPFVTDLAKMPHLLVAGSTGSGKSVCLNALITSLVYRLHPLHIRFVMIDPKMLELSVYEGIPHLARSVVTSPKHAERILSDVVAEMERRYRTLANASVRNIADFNKRQKKEEDKLPYIVVLVDELADLMMSATSSKTEMLITRLAQMARAVGIHLVLATQRPSVDVITGLIKANFPARIAFQVSSKVDSRTIIDANGAEKLLGAGDMLFLSTGQPEPMRIHGAYISSDETDDIVNFIKEQGLEMFTLKNISQSNEDTAEAEVDTGDPLFREACDVVIRHKQGSVSLLQRRLGIGYQRAARLIDRLEQAGIVSPFDGSKARDVMVDRAYVDALFAGEGSPVSSPESDSN